MEPRGKLSGARCGFRRLRMPPGYEITVAGITFREQTFGVSKERNKTRAAGASLPGNSGNMGEIILYGNYVVGNGEFRKIGRKDGEMLICVDDGSCVGCCSD
ncbi:hypothetical protein KM043_006991 [Ampulex compressa]|nr:hypothetical protein KM043_006991 [Ampulex compressa]